MRMVRVEKEAKDVELMAAAARTAREATQMVAVRVRQMGELMRKQAVLGWRGRHDELARRAEGIYAHLGARGGSAPVGATGGAPLSAADGAVGELFGAAGEAMANARKSNSTLSSLLFGKEQGRAAGGRAAGRRASASKPKKSEAIV